MYESGYDAGKEDGITIGENNVLSNATGGIAFDGVNYIWSWATYNNTVFATASDYITVSSGDIEGYIDSVDQTNQIVYGSSYDGSVSVILHAR